MKKIIVLFLGASVLSSPMHAMGAHKPQPWRLSRFTKGSGAFTGV